MPNPLLIVALVISYLIGAIPFAVLIGRWARGVDVRRTGTGNVGAMNTFRSVGRAAGVLVALLDALKAVLAMALGRIVAGPEGAVLCGTAAIIGHCFSPYLIFANRTGLSQGWKLALRRVGGKGLASGVAVLLLIDWRVGIVGVVVFVLGMAILRKDETWPTIIGVALTAPLLWWLTRNLVSTIAVLVVSVVIIVKHLPDLRTGFYVQVTSDEY